MRFLLLQRHLSKNLLLYQHACGAKAKLLPIKATLHGMRASSSYIFFNVVINRILSLVFFILGAYFLFTTLSSGLHLIREEKKAHNETVIIIVTPTHRRLERLADMTRLSNTLRHVSNLHWIVVEDGNHTVPAVERILFRSGLPFIYLNTVSSPGMPRRGWTHRDLALRYIRENYAENISAVVYFADDDNSYDVRLFDEYIRKVKRIGIWAVGLVGGALVEAPKVEGGKISAWNVMFAPKREFATDMAGFAIHMRELRRTNASFTTADCAKAAKQGPENCFLRQFGYKKEEVEPFGHDRVPMEILVWHTKTTKTTGTKGPTYGYAIEN